MPHLSVFSALSVLSVLSVLSDMPEMPPHADETAGQTEEDAEYHDEEQVLRFEEDQAGEGPAALVAKEDVPRVAEGEGKQAAE